jgi:hypothetical protein
MTGRPDVHSRFLYLTNFTQMVASGVTPSLVVTGQGGLGKTHTVTQTIEKMGMSEGIDYVFFKGYSTARGLYNTLYDNNGKLIIFDDCDSVLEDRVSVNILKSALDSYDKRVISWMSRPTRGDTYPQQFEFGGNIIFISNKTKSSLDGALLTRSIVVDLEMTNAEKIERIRGIMGSILPQLPTDIKEDAVKFLESNPQFDINFRTFIMVSKIRNSFPHNWGDMSRYMLSVME